MNTITAKELRDNLDRIVARARAGETIKVTYRSKPAFTITPEPKRQPKRPKPGSPEAIQQFLAGAEILRAQAKANGYRLPVGKSYKDVYYEDMARKYGIE